MGKAIFAVVKLAYRTILRKYLKKLIDNPDSQVDDIALEVLDRIFEYNG